MIPEFQDIFTGDYLQIGKNGGTIRELRVKHILKPRNYKRRIKYEIYM